MKLPFRLYMSKEKLVLASNFLMKRITRLKKEYRTIFQLWELIQTLKTLIPKSEFGPFSKDSSSWLTTLVKFQVHLAIEVEFPSANKSTSTVLETSAKPHRSFKQFSICNSDISSYKEFIWLISKWTNRSSMKCHKSLMV